MVRAEEGAELERGAEGWGEKEQAREGEKGGEERETGREGRQRTRDPAAENGEKMARLALEMGDS